MVSSINDTRGLTREFGNLETFIMWSYLDSSGDIRRAADKVLWENSERTGKSRGFSYDSLLGFQCTQDVFDAIAVELDTSFGVRGKSAENNKWARFEDALFRAAELAGISTEEDSLYDVCTWFLAFAMERVNFRRIVEKHFENYEYDVKSNTLKLRDSDVGEP